MEEGLMYIVIAIVVVIFIGYSLYVAQQQREAWEKAADRLGFIFNPGGFLSQPRMSGDHHGKSVTAWVRKERRGGRRNRRSVYFTVVTAELDAPCWQGVQITEHGFTDSIAKFFGGEDQEIGDGDFDSNFRVKGAVGDECRDCLALPEVKDAIRQLARAYRTFKIENGTIHIECKKRVTSAGDLIRRVNRVVDAAVELDGAAGVSADHGTDVTTPGIDDWTSQGESQDLFPEFDDNSDNPPQKEPEQQDSSAVW